MMDDEGLSVVKRKRQPNFNLKEKMELFTIIHEKYKDIVEDKATDKCSANEKDKCWDKVETNFNAVTTTGIFREKDCLKRCYENRKREVRKLIAREKQEQMKTGGGTPEKIVLDAADEILLQIMNPKSVVGLENPYDSDSIRDKLIRKDLEKDDKKAFWLNKKNIEEEFPSFKKANDFKKPKHPALTPSYCSQITIQDTNDTREDNNDLLEEANNTIYKVDSLIDLQAIYNGEERSKGLKVPSNSSREATTDELEEKNMQMYTESSNSSHQNKDNVEEELPEKIQENKSLKGMAEKGRKSSTGAGRGKVQRTRRTQLVPNRRPGIQILASSHIAKKYDELLDQRKVLLDKQIKLANEDLTFQRAKNRLEIELLNLKVEREKKNLIDAH